MKKFQRNDTDSSWNKSSSRYIMTSYFQPILLWTGAMLICRFVSGSTPMSLLKPIGFNHAIISFRALDLLVLPSETSQAVKQRLLNFVRSLSTVISFAYCLSRYFLFLFWKKHDQQNLEMLFYKWVMYLFHLFLSSS